MNNQFSTIAFDFDTAKSDFEEELTKADSTLDYINMWWDWYDNSLELGGVPVDYRFNDAIKEVIFTKHGFSTCWLNHSDGWETMYYQKLVKEGTDIVKPKYELSDARQFRGISNKSTGKE